MVVSFWSNYAKSGVTTNISAISAAFSLLYPKKITLLSNHFEKRSLGYMLLGKGYDDLLHESLKYDNYGNKNFYLRKLLSYNNFSVLNGCSYDGLENGLYYYLQVKRYCSQIYEINQFDFINETVDYLNQLSDYVFIDLQSQESLSSLQLLEASDLIVVNFRQDETLIRNFFKRYSSIAGKCFFIISSYNEKGAYLKRNLVRDYRIHPERVAVLPYNPEFVCGFDDGRIVPYVCNYLNCGKKSRQYRYIWFLRYAAELLMKNLNNICSFCGEDEKNA